MSRFNRGTVRTPPRSPVTSVADRAARTALGAPGYRRNRQSELYLLAICNMPGEKVLHEGADARVTRFKELVRECAALHPDWTAGLIAYLRGPAGLRLAPVIAAAEYAWARSHGYQKDKLAPVTWEDATIRRVVDSALQRPDEPGEIVAYWIASYGRGTIPHGLKRGVADAVVRMYNERGVLRWDSAEAAVRFGDVVELVAPRYNRKVYGTFRDSLYKYLIDSRHGRDDLDVSALPVIARARDIFAMPVAARHAFLTAPGGAARITEAGIRWEAVAGWLQGPMDAAAWEACIPSMGVDALVRNLRNFDKAGVSDEVAAGVAAKLADPLTAARSRMLPFRFLAAYRAAPSLRWSWPLEQALNLSLAKVPELRGRTLILVDRSPSMWHYKLSEHSDMDWADAAAVFAASLALRAEHADLVEFWADSKPVRFRRGESVLPLVQRFSVQPEPGGTDIPLAVRRHLTPDHSRVVILTDEQTQAGWLPSNCAGGAWPFRPIRPDSMPPTLIDDLVPKNVPLYMWNFAGYATGATPSGSGNRHTLGGLTDAAFAAIPVLEAGRDADWPFPYGKAPARLA